MTGQAKIAIWAILAIGARVCVLLIALGVVALVAILFAEAVRRVVVQQRRLIRWLRRGSK